MHLRADACFATQILALSRAFATPIEVFAADAPVVRTGEDEAASKPARISCVKPMVHLPSSAEAFSFRCVAATIRALCTRASTTIACVRRDHVWEHCVRRHHHQTRRRFCVARAAQRRPAAMASTSSRARKPSQRAREIAGALLVSPAPPPGRRRRRHDRDAVLRSILAPHRMTTTPPRHRPSARPARANRRQKGECPRHLALARLGLI